MRRRNRPITIENDLGIGKHLESIDKKLTTGAVIPIAEEKKEIEATTVLL